MTQPKMQDKDPLKKFYNAHSSFVLPRNKLTKKVEKSLRIRKCPFKMLTNDGRTAIIHTMDAHGQFPIKGEINGELFMWEKDGTGGIDNASNLMEK